MFSGKDLQRWAETGQIKGGPNLDRAHIPDDLRQTKGRDLDALAVEWNIMGRSRMTADEKRAAIADARGSAAPDPS